MLNAEKVQEKSATRIDAIVVCLAGLEGRITWGGGLDS
jgi:hypothetical protein